MTDPLYKVSEPGHGDRFEPRPFWRAADWAFSDDHPHAGLIEDHVLFAAEFDEVNIHLLPRVRRVRVRLDSAERARRLRACGLSWQRRMRAVVFVAEADRAEVERFQPTVFVFDRSGFERTPTDEFVARAPQTALSSETIPIVEAIARWQIDVIYVDDIEALEQQLRDAGVDHQIQA